MEEKGWGKSNTKKYKIGWKKKNQLQFLSLN